MKVNRFNFIKAEWPSLFDIISDVEQNLTRSPNVSIIKLRQLIEFTLKHIAEYENVQKSIENADLKIMLEELPKGNYIPIKFINLLNNIRKIGNRAVHDNYSNSLQAIELYDKTYEFLVWFVCSYGEMEFRNYLVGLDMYDKVLFQDYLLEIKLGNKTIEKKKKKIEPVNENRSSVATVESIKKAAEKGDAEAQFKLGNIYLGYYEEIDDDGLFEEAINMYKSSAKKRNISALLKLIELEWESEYDTEIGVEIDFKIDLKWIRDLAIQGNTDAQYLLGNMYFYGIEVDEDNDLALKWIKISADNGNTGAKQDLVHLYYYYDGMIEEIDFKMAIESFTADAENGNCEAQEMLGRLYSDEDGENPDFEEAMKWYEKAAEQGSSLAKDWIAEQKDREI